MLITYCIFAAIGIPAALMVGSMIAAPIKLIEIAAASPTYIWGSSMSAKKRLRLHKGKWFRFDTRFRTGSAVLGSDIVIPQVVNGKPLPEWVEIYVGPYDSYKEALRA